MGRLLVLRGSRTSDDLDQLARDDSLTCSVEEDGELANHVAGVLGRVLHGISSSRLLAGVTFGQCPVERVGEGILAEVTKDILVNLECGEVGCGIC